MEGCGDSLCSVKKPTGQMTNGGCMCRKSRLIWKIDTLTADKKVLREALEETKKNIHSHPGHIWSIADKALKATEKKDQS